jgi:hypothetical protein
MGYNRRVKWREKSKAWMRRERESRLDRSNIRSKLFEEFWKDRQNSEIILADCENFEKRKGKAEYEESLGKRNCASNWEGSILVWEVEVVRADDEENGEREGVDRVEEAEEREGLDMERDGKVNRRLDVILGDCIFAAEVDRGDISSFCSSMNGYSIWDEESDTERGRESGERGTSKRPMILLGKKIILERS